ncbi:MAG: tRNA lysidine(34) synthetase TilS [Paracoccus sp. (in: a-proteobacteria)]|uniref:tRNA lysidine(34) synthetase TilS n=1 Tax=Paracoccus sp. TaxID=267 RepID=UPI0026E0034E|nr:tRNA lysidine(34) synthetase TilS [Paracoccus sp. (in: a-proteobacteria)]MDO5622257.1 tRNA lysidine(34) synthetase TilS [Paracoccus sp. (in: a-proteobacteria)]
MPPDPAKAIRDTLDRIAPHGTLGVAVSGGGDSLALLHITADWAGPQRRIEAATVDHNLRPESQAEAMMVGEQARALGIPHEILNWTPETHGNLQANARQARLDLLSQWAARRGLSAVLLAHTQDDQAETLLMRLARGSGLDGLSGMAEARTAQGILWLRPALEVSRESLRDWLRRRGLTWAEDPSNQNPEYERVRIRQTMAALALDPAMLARSATNLRRARASLDQIAADWLTRARVHASASLTLPPMQDAPPEIIRRCLLTALRWLTGADYPPRETATAAALAQIAAGHRATLDGALLAPGTNGLRMLREPAAAARAVAVTGGIWDNRWRVDDLPPGQEWRALGHAPLPDLPWREAGLTRDEAASLPAIWSGPDLVAAPLLSGDKSTAKPLRTGKDLLSMLGTH